MPLRSKNMSEHNPEKRFRLRQGEKVVGYMRKFSDVMVMYSRDSFWWSGRQMAYNDIDEWTGLLDKNGRHIYEWDILKYKMDPDGDNMEGVILWERNEEVFGIRSLTSETFIPLFLNEVQMFNPRQMQVFSYLFINPDLQEKLGLDE